MQNPKKIYLAFDKYDNCVAYTDNKAIIKRYVKERKKNGYYYTILDKSDIPRFMEYIESGHSFIDELEAYTVNRDSDIRNIMTYSEYEMFWDSFSYFLPTIDLTFNELDNLLRYIKLNDKETEALLKLFYILYSSTGDDEYENGYYHSSDISYDEEKALQCWIKHNL